MESTLNRFNWIARLYDPLVRIVFGKHVVNAQILYLSSIEANSKVLILGGGTGWILKHLHDLQPSSIIYYVEASSKMIALAKKNSAEFTSKIHFIHGTENTIPSHLKFDVIVTNFYFDLFTNEELSRVVSVVSKLIHSKTRWIVTEFQNSKRIYHRFLLNVMYRFFKITCGLNTMKLPAWEEQLALAGFKESKTQLFFNGFIKTSISKFSTE